MSTKQNSIVKQIWEEEHHLNIILWFHKYIDTQSNFCVYKRQSLEATSQQHLFILLLANI
jgi:hypothetical protein